jgi:GPI ethanolamine phosphate transferase 3 subunit O
VLTFNSLIHAVGIYFFTKGFLLTRLVLEHQSSCQITPVLDHSPSQADALSSGCWHPKTFNKAVVVIIDALRYDFTVPFRPRFEGDPPRLFHNALPVLYETATEHPQNAFLLPFIADPPTTTLQRLKGLTTGTLPTFVDAGSNFAGTAIEEDNILLQLIKAGKTLVHLGDDTWQSLFPGYFDTNLTHAYDSFNVWDLHTVDNGVTEHILPLLEESKSSQWDVIFAHYLGVDHAGHRYGPDHQAMTAKLQQMDGNIREIMNLIDNDTLLVVMGDHGMDSKGDHGGESDDEVEAALWMYANTPSFGRTRQDFFEPPSDAKVRQIGQIDLVPTLSLLLGLPIPFNNLGSPIDEAFIGNKGNDWKNLVTVNRITSAQIRRYQIEYAKARSVDQTSTSSLVSSWADAEAFWEAQIEGRKPTSEQVREAYQRSKDFQIKTLSLCRDLWARFDLVSMGEGIIILIASIVLLLAFTGSIRGDRAELTPLFLQRVGIATPSFAVASCLFAMSTSQISKVDASLLGAASGGILGAFSTLVSIPRRLSSPLPSSLWGWLAVIFVLLQSIGFASNSYTIWEDEILLFFLATFGVLAGFSSLRQTLTVDRVLGLYHSIAFVLLTRLASFSRLCREEQMPLCQSTYYSSATSSTSAPWTLMIPFLVALVLPSVIKSYYQGTRSYEGSAIFWVGFAFRIGLLLVAVFWTLDAADDGEWLTISKSTLKSIRVVVAQLVLAIALAAGTTTYALAKPCVNIAMASPSNIKDDGPLSSTPLQANTKPTVTILGYANVHGARFFLLVTNVVLAALIVQKPMGEGSIAILTWQILSLLEILDTNNLTMTDSTIGPIILALLGSFHFFKTGHTATLSSIQWESAFVPLHTIRYPWSPLLVILNYFGPQIITATAVPLAVLWKRPISSQYDRKGDLSRSTGRALLSPAAKAVSTHLMYYGTINLATTMWAAWLRRHLMLYRIFCPRWMMGAAVLLVVDLICVLVSLGGLRWSMLSIGEVFGWG